MQIYPSQNNSFGASFPCIIKTLYKEGAFGDKVTKGFYGGDLTFSNVSVEHLVPYSRCGRSDLNNLVLATRRRNKKRGTKPLRFFINIDFATKYLEQFSGIVIPGKFNGNDYIRMITKKLKDMGIILSPGGWERKVKTKPKMTRSGRTYR